MKQLTIFGTTERAGRKTKVWGEGYAGKVGTGPANETCRTCCFAQRVRKAVVCNRFGRKAGPLNRIAIRLAAPACSFFAPRAKGSTL